MVARMEYEWDEQKRLSNIAKHGVDFAAAFRLDWDNAVFFADDIADGEHRSRMLCWLGDRLVFVIYTLRGSRCRIISMRKATKSEYRIYGDG